MKRNEQLYTCLNKVMLSKLLQIVAISIQCVIWFLLRGRKFPSDRKKVSRSAFVSAEFVIILMFF